MKERVVRATFVGDTQVGKTKFIITSLIGVFPYEYIPTIFDNYIKTVDFQTIKYHINMLDTISDKNLGKQINDLVYLNSDIVLFCFSVDSKNSLDLIQTYWIPEVNKMCTNYCCFLVGMKCDMRHSVNKNDTQFVTINEALHVANEIGAIR
ncbi:GTP-binding protein rho5 precursor, putative [Entamoeba invadens IP1]|uniref:small monomeric GTPase n=1 Tax=Entamoeba invadens IP1 TaxID=370355 RepID=A0A0A1TYZ9_ENTIV|nr:GTP-binding protein rho5 precursor, putative [Entamoeba invadens IP1]ELP86776.1 GTP-binding protein rho5 precursor, putative [Entamoeba invadens IP1]|eukprot:XP_004253547.1 GTP-binding protein rho5 precursor, putative [Entamoeba invadens IP1]